MTQILTGIGALVPGILVYISDRPEQKTYFIHKLHIHLQHRLPNIFGPLGKNLPDFIHPFSFILITAGLMACRRKEYRIICLGWLGVNISFELGQKYRSLPVAAIPQWFAGIPFLENAEAFFSRGTYDVSDMAAMALGTIAAYAVLLMTQTKKEKGSIKDETI